MYLIPRKVQLVAITFLLLAQICEKQQLKICLEKRRVAICSRTVRKTTTSREIGRPLRKKLKFVVWRSFSRLTLAHIISSYIIVFLSTLQLLCQITGAIKNNNWSSSSRSLKNNITMAFSLETILLQIGGKSPRGRPKYAYLM